MSNKLIAATLYLILCLSCCSTPSSFHYKNFYSHLEKTPQQPKAIWRSDNFLEIYVNARHLDYGDNYSFLKTLAKHPSDGSKNRDVGHVWVYLQGKCNGKFIYVYGGHSGERGLHQAKYFDGIMNYLDFGYANPTEDQMKCPRYEANPVKYLWDIQKDGFFEPGAGRHRPTYAIKIDLNEDQFINMLSFIETYDFSSYAISGNQCASFAAQLASIAGIDLECEVTIIINQCLYLYGDKIRLWEDPNYSELTISSPDVLERSLMKIVSEGRAEYIDCYED